MEQLIRTIKAVSVKKVDEGNIGFLTEEEDRWFNMIGEPEVLKEWLKSTINKGNKIAFELNNGYVDNLQLKEKGEIKETTGDMTTFEDLLSDAHKKFKNFSIKTKLIENDWENKRAIFKAAVEVTTDGGSYDYQAYGDATQENCGQMVKAHYIRMAETRAIARALRFATNNANTAEEETENGKLPEK